MFVASACGHKVQVMAPQPASVPAAPSPAQRQPAPPGQPESRPAAPVPEPPPEAAVTVPAVPSFPVPSAVPPSPAIRIGLSTSAKEVRISCAGGYYLVEKKAEAPRELITGELRVRVEQEADESSEVFRVQVASFAKPENADELRRELARRFELPIVTRESSAGLKQVRIGDFSTREEASKFADNELAAAGYRGVVVVRETSASGGGTPTLALRGAGNLFRVSRTGFLFFPDSAGTPLELDGKRYRGLLDLGLNATNRITTVNQLGMEEYLFGVVPAEISPTAYPEFAALAAQSIAARTYALKNMGRFRSEGFDLTADVRSQVYTGLSGESEAANEAVRQTFGMAIYYQGKLIEAMYSSTCGGRTEDFSKVFDGPDIPYLKSVICAVEDVGTAGIGTELTGSHGGGQPIVADDGSMANRSLDLAHVIGLVPDAVPDTYFTSTPDSAEVRRWMDRALALAAKPAIASTPPSDITSRSGFIRFAVESFFGTEEIARRISSADTEYYVGNLRDGNEVPAPARAPLAYLMQAGLWHPYPDNSARPKQPVRRTDALCLLIKWIQSAEVDTLRAGVFTGPGAAPGGDGPNGTSFIGIKAGRQMLQLPLSEDLRLYRIADGRSIPVDSVKVIGNEKLSYHLARDGRIDFLEIELNPAGAASDRFSPVATWRTTLSRAAIAEKLRSLASAAGEFRDLKPSRFGSSGRAVQVQVIGTKGSVFLNGYRVRNALGLRDTLFTIERSRNAEGSVENFTFRGRGWGHGVGLCQVGAYGMARAGRSYEEILKAYYTGVEIKKAY